MHLGQKIKNYCVKRCQKMSRAGRSGPFASLCVHGAHGTCSVPHEHFLRERHEEELNSSKTCLFRIRLQCAYIWTSLLPPFIWESTAKKTRFPKIAFSLKVSRVFNSKKKVKPFLPGAASVGDTVPQFTIHCICAITKTTNREQPH